MKCLSWYYTTASLLPSLLIFRNYQITTFPYFFYGDINVILFIYRQKAKIVHMERQSKESETDLHKAMFLKGQEENFKLQVSGLDYILNYK